MSHVKFKLCAFMTYLCCCEISLGSMSRTCHSTFRTSSHTVIVICRDYKLRISNLRIVNVSMSILEDIYPCISNF